MRISRLAPILALLISWAGHASPPGSYRFCYGLDHPADLPVILDLHLDTLYVQLQVDEVVNLQPVRDLIHQARQQGLKVIVELPTLLTTSYRVSPYEQRYSESVRELIAGLVGQLRDEPGLTAWATASFLERRLDINDADFRIYLQTEYGELDRLNTQWGAGFPTWPTISIEQARQLEGDAPYKIGPAIIDLSDYQADAYRRVMQLWLQAIRGHDSARPVLTGRVTLYRSLLSIPPGYDVVCVSMPPDVLENDLQAHNPQALDLARRGGRFHVLPTFRVPDNTNPAYASGAMRGWSQHAALHGAVGFGLEDGEKLSEIYAFEKRREARWRMLSNAIRDAAAVPFGFAPKPTTAVIYSPYASGFDVTRQPVYGYIVDYLPGEPSNLIYALRLGTRYGLVDYLSVNDLKQRDLNDYGCILAPACLNLPLPQAGQLEEYVTQGGALIADLGLGAYQTKSWTQMPPVIQQAFGVLALVELKERLSDLTAAEGLRALSPWPRSTKAGGTFSPRGAASASATDRRTYPVSGWTAEALLAEQAAPLATASVRFNEDKRPLFGGVVGQQHGSGLAIFATHPLWQYWPLTDGLSQVLHGHLMARRADYALVQAGLLQAGLYFSGGAEGAGIYNPGQTSALAQLWAYAAQSHAHTDCASNFLAAPGERGLKPGAGLLVADVPGQQARHLARTALTVQPYAGDATVQMRQYDTQQVVFQIAGAGCIVAPTSRGLQLRGGEAVSVRLILSNGIYAVPAHSRHAVVVRTRNKDVRTTLTANERGELDLSDVYASSTVQVTGNRE